MFQEIYPRSISDTARSSLGLFEELGELAEAVRVFERFPKYFAGEAADIFSYLMGIANEHALRMGQEEGRSFNLHDEYLKRFPGLCLACGHRVCVCPAIPRATVGRLAKELDIAPTEELFDSSAEVSISEGRVAAAAVLKEIGGIPMIVERFPADRGDANSALIFLLMKLASAMEESNQHLAERFHAAAIELGSSVSEAGSKSSEGYLSTHGSLLSGLRDALRLTQQAKLGATAPLGEDSLAFKLGQALAKLKILIVYATPADQDALRIAAEVRAIRQSIKMAGREHMIEVTDLPAATPDDLRRALLTKEYEIVHFAGHSNSESFVFENDDGSSRYVGLAALAKLFESHIGVRCVVFNSCEALTDLVTPIAECTVGMSEPIDDSSALAFATGFYDAIATGREFELAVEEGKSAARLKGLKVPNVKILQRSRVPKVKEDAQRL